MMNSGLLLASMAIFGAYGTCPNNVHTFSTAMNKSDDTANHALPLTAKMSGDVRTFRTAVQLSTVSHLLPGAGRSKE